LIRPEPFIVTLTDRIPHETREYHLHTEAENMERLIKVLERIAGSLAVIAERQRLLTPEGDQ
jgi:hypothetical protein